MNNTTRLQLIDGPQYGYLEVKEGANVPLNFSVSDIRDISSRSGMFSKTIALAGTKNNNDILNNYFDVNIVAGTFDVNKRQKVAIVQNGIILRDNCFMRLLKVKKKQSVATNVDEWVEYEVQVTDELGDFFKEVGNKELKELGGWDEYKHIYGVDAVVDSFDHTVDDGYKYTLPWIKREVSLGYDYIMNDLMPGVYAKQIFDRIHMLNGFSYDWATMTDNDTQFDKSILPYAGDKKKLTEEYIDSVEVIAGNSTNQEIGAVLIGGETNKYSSSVLEADDEVKDKGGLYDPTTSEYQNTYTLTAPNKLNYEISFNWKIEMINHGTEQVRMGEDNPLNPPGNINETNTGARPRVGVKLGSNIVAYTEIKNPIFNDFSGMVGSDSPLNGEALGSVRQINGVDYLTTRGRVLLDGGETKELCYGSQTSTIPITSINPSDILIAFKDIRAIVGSPNPYFWFETSSGQGAEVEYKFTISKLEINIAPDSQNGLMPGTEIDIKNFLPTKMKQSDFIKTIYQKYNLYVEIDPDNPSKLIYTSRDKFYDDGTVKDWTEKLDKKREQELYFIPDITTKKMILSYKDDDKDFLLDAYRGETSKTFGQVDVTFENENIKGEERKEEVFSPTINMETDFGAILPVFNADFKMNPRILQDGGKLPCQEYSLRESGNKTITSSFYPHLSMFDKPYNPTFSTEYAQSSYYAYNPGLFTENNLYTSHWRRTLAQINSGKMLKAWFWLTEEDIQGLRMNDKIKLNNAYYYINAVIDYDANSNSVTKVELLTVEDNLKLPRIGGGIKDVGIIKDVVSGTLRPRVPSVPGGFFTGVIAEVIKKRYDESVVVSGPTSLTGNIGIGNTLPNGFRGVMIGDNLSPTEDGFYIDDISITNEGIVKNDASIIIDDSDNISISGDILDFSGMDQIDFSGVDIIGGVMGPTGATGMVGPTGPQGIPGINGTSGTSGVNGSNGTSGTSGVNGTSGTSGIDGIDGSNGSSGTSGIDGTSGTSGVNGSNGTSGINGSNGTSGIDGTSGINGSNGSNGTSGTSGVNGSNGSSGTSGIDGSNGSSGTSGLNGINGTSGIDGSNGSSGTSGVNGSNGSSGTSGINGSNGTSGIDGTSGINGSNGSNGTSGTSGINGTSGIDGTSGINGSNGTSGIDGTSGTSGVNGSNGSSGTSGINGTSGVNGSNGSNGSSGTSGINGTSGVNGSNGSNGSSGTSGIDGTSGVNGSNGSNGSSGTSGIDGVNGSNGSSGTSGVNGSNGSSGTSGINGSDGSNGTSGVSGTSGIDGVNGSDGSDGTSGTSGINGSDGSNGSSGTSGIDGVNGIDGTSGVNGTSGTSGIDGTSGINGTSGIDGTSGINGSSGTSGAQGPQGIPGPVGDYVESIDRISTMIGDGVNIDNTDPKNPKIGLQDRLPTNITRAEINESPDWFIDNYPRSTIIEIKAGNKIGSILGTDSYYVVMETNIPGTNWSSNNVAPVQTITSNRNGRMATRYAIDGTTWSPWKEVTLDGVQSVTRENSRAPVNLTDPKNPIILEQKHLPVLDTRNDNEPPSFYLGAGGKGVNYEFKRISTIGVGSIFNSGSYCSLETISQWGDASGGYPFQIARNPADGKIAKRYGTSDTTWSNWTEIGTGSGGGSSMEIIHITYAFLAEDKYNNQLIPGARYYITDRDIWIDALDTDKLSMECKRHFRVVRDIHYTPHTTTGFFTSRYLGIYGQTIAKGSVPNSTLINDRYFAIWGGRMWYRDISGSDTPGSSNETIAGGWSLQATTNNTYYESKIFDIKYNFDDDIIWEQSDDRGNKIKRVNSTTSYIDITDWGNTSIYNNENFGIYNNFRGSNKAIIYDNSNSGSIYYNSNRDIYNNSNNGSIYNNSNTDIYNNSNNGSIYNNSNNSIEDNSNNGGIYNNSNNGSIYDNSNDGDINNNSNIIGITNIRNNANNGYIRGNNMNGSYRLDHNTNNGNIGSAGTTIRNANITDSQVNK